MTIDGFTFGGQKIIPSIAGVAQRLSTRQLLKMAKGKSTENDGDISCPSEEQSLNALVSFFSVKHSQPCTAR